MIKNLGAYKKQLTYLFFLLILIDSLLLAFFPLGAASNFGIRPMTHKCFGLIIRSEKFTKLLPEGDITFFAIGNRAFRYYVPHHLIDERPLCLGLDVWYGE